MNNPTDGQSIPPRDPNQTPDNSLSGSETTPVSNPLAASANPVPNPVDNPVATGGAAAESASVVGEPGPSQTPHYGASSAQQGSWVLDGKEQTGDAAQIMRQRREAAQAAQDKPARQAEQVPPAQAQPTGTNAFAKPTNPFGPSAPGGGAPGSFGNFNPSSPVTPPPGYGSQPAVVSLPGRGLPITLIVLAVVVMLIVAPVAGFIRLGVTVLSAVSGDTVYEIDTNSASLATEFEGYTFVQAIDEDSKDWTCEVLVDGEVAEPYQEEDEDFDESLGLGDWTESTSVFAEVYKIEGEKDVSFSCVSDSDPSKTLDGIMILPNLSVGGIFGSPLIVFLGVEVIGIGMLVAGIVWLVKRNRKRRQIITGVAV